MSFSKESINRATGAVTTQASYSHSQVRSVQFETSRYNYVPVICLELNPKSYGNTIKIISSEIDVGARSVIVEKELGDAFTSSEFNLQVENRRLKNLLFMGCYASVCVWATAQSAVERGYTIASSSELISDSNSLRRSKFNFHDKSFGWYRKYCKTFI